jgi:hypothetical protein
LAGWIYFGFPPCRLFANTRTSIRLSLRFHRNRLAFSAPLQGASSGAIAFAGSNRTVDACYKQVQVDLCEGGVAGIMVDTTMPTAEFQRVQRHGIAFHVLSHRHNNWYRTVLLVTAFVQVSTQRRQGPSTDLAPKRFAELYA